ncbi:MAG TPA: hypothetical protein VMZ26_09765 [Pyrinomonadaceae bacterium]|nr:hypothetical protein [Pyrinomonadaceae bacterium]
MEATARATDQNSMSSIENSNIEPSGIKGWGVDADPENDPTYPMKVRKPEVDHAGYTWDRPQQQPIDVEVLHSNERPNVAATFGTSVPPSGLSGMIRRGAFKYSENSYAHWLPLMLADRIQVFEGVLGDLSTGRVPNIFSELGWKAEWKHDPARVVKKVAIGGAIALGLYALLRHKRPEMEGEQFRRDVSRPTVEPENFEDMN